MWKASGLKKTFNQFEKYALDLLLTFLILTIQFEIKDINNKRAYCPMQSYYF